VGSGPDVAPAGATVAKLSAVTAAPAITVIGKTRSLDMAASYHLAVEAPAMP
jgi:hypothetical protein